MPAIASKALIKMMELSRTAAFVQMVNTHGLLYGGKSGIFLKYLQSRWELLVLSRLLF